VQRPYVLVNMAVSADGKIDTVERDGARISGRVDTARVDRLRAAADAVMVGGHTLLREDPRLTVRDPALVEQRSRLGQPAQPIKVAVVSRIGAPGDTEALPQDSRFLADGGGRVIICTTTRTDAAAIDWLRDQGAETVVHDAERVDLTSALGHLATDGVEHLMVEGGSTLVAALLAEGLVDEIQLAIAPLVFGGEQAPSPVGGPGLAAREAIHLSLAGVEQDADDDVILRYLVTRGS
jgi:2,5-diamino-6-(ribosylamino)-4(3H)-pyrimidinone 5'-phosphate reductase